MISREPGGLEQATLLAIDDVLENRLLVASLLKKQGAEVVTVASGPAGLQCLRDGLRPDLILLDVMMPEMDGFAVLAELKAHAEWREIPVMLLTALESDEVQIRAFQAGAVDYISKPIKADLLINRVQVHVQLQKAKENLRQQQQSLKDEIARQVQQSRLLENQLQIALEASGFVVWRTDAACHHLRFATPVRMLLGYDWRSVPVEDYLALVHPDERSIAAALLHPESGELKTGDYRVQHAHGHWVWVEVRCERMNNAPGPIIGTLSDLSNRKTQERVLEANLLAQKELNRRLEEAHNQLLQSEKMASIGQLAAGVAHELNNPISFVYSNLGTLDLYLHDILSILDAFRMAAEADDGEALARARQLVKDKDLDYIRQDVLDLMHESKDGLDRLRKIVLDLKSFSRVGTQEWEEADLHEGLDSTLNIVWNELKYKCTVNKEYGDIPPVHCVISQLNQVFMNLLVNAGQAIEQQGTITIRTYRQDEGHVCVEVEDTGGGIAPENLNRVFEPFFTTKPVGKGTGLGLSVSYSIIQRHHGSISVRSQPGQGTCFTVTLPVHPPLAANQPN